MKETAARNGIFYGWFIVAAGAFALFMSMGARNGFGVFVVPMTDDLGWSRTEISAAIAVGILVNGLSQPFLGRLYDRFGGRSVISLSLLVLGISTILITFTSDFGLSFAPAISLPFLEIELSASLLFLILIYGLVMSTASSGVSLVTVHAVLAKWFVRRRGVVLSLCTAGTSLGGLILTPFAASLIIWTHWRVAWLVLGVLVLILALPLVGLLMRDKPEDMGEIPDGRGGETQPPAIFTMVWKVAWSFIQLIALPLVAAIWLVAFITRDKKDFVANPASTAPLESDSWKDSFRSPPIWQLSGAYFVCGVTTLIISTHYVPVRHRPWHQPGGRGDGLRNDAGAERGGRHGGRHSLRQVQPEEYARHHLLHQVFRIRDARYSQHPIEPSGSRHPTLGRDLDFRVLRRHVLDSHAAADVLSDG